jgi:pimeloyl-ACP methyl ester carboxylesterase
MAWVTRDTVLREDARVELAVRIEGQGPRLVLVHGGIGPELSWERQLPLADRWTLVIPWRRGYGESPPVERQDWEADVDDLDALVEPGDRLVGFSYGGLSASIVAGRRAEELAALVLIEPPLFALAPDDPLVRPMIELSSRFTSGETADDPDAHWRFLSVAGIERPRDEAEAREIEHLTRMARNLRPPVDARPDLAAVRAAGLRTLSVSGEHNPALDRLCDLIAEQTGGERLRLAGSRHAVQRAPGFNERLEAFLGGT